MPLPSFVLADAAPIPEVPPWVTQAGPYALLVIAVVWLARKWDKSNAEMQAIVREVVTTVTANTAAMGAFTLTLQEVREAIKDSRRA